MGVHASLALKGPTNASTGSSRFHVLVNLASEHRNCNCNDNDNDNDDNDNDP